MTFKKSLKSFASKDIMNRIKMQFPEWVKIFSNHISNK